MTLAHGTERLESERLVLRRVALNDLPFFVRLHAMPKVAQGLWSEGQPRSAEQTEVWLRETLASYEELALGYLAVVRKADATLIGRCGLMDMAIEAAAPKGRLRKGWFGRKEVPNGIALTFECELGYTFDPPVWRQGYASEAAQCVRDYARDALGLTYAVSAILSHNEPSRRVAERGGATFDGRMEAVGLTFDRYVWQLQRGGLPQPLACAR